MKIYKIVGKMPVQNSTGYIRFEKMDLTDWFTSDPEEKLKEFEKYLLKKEQVWVNDEYFAPIEVRIEALDISELQSKPQLTETGLMVQKAYLERTDENV